MANTLHECRLSYILNTPTSQILPRSIKLLVKDKIGLMENQDWHSRIFESSVCVNYRLFKSNLCFEEYLTILNHKERVDLCKFRCGNHKLPIVTGRHANIERHERVCHLCDKQSVGEEYHYVFICPAFNTERAKYLDTKQIRYPNVLAISNLSKFCRIIMDRCKTNASQAEPKTKKCKKQTKPKRPVTETHSTTSDDTINKKVKQVRKKRVNKSREAY